MADNQLRGNLKVEADLRGQANVAGSGGGGLIGDGFAEAGASVAKEIAGFGAKVGAWADHAAKVEGAQAGELAGLDPEFRPSRQMTIRGEAFDKAGLHVMQGMLKQSIAADVEGLVDKHGNNPKAVDKAFAERRDGWLGSAPPELQAELTLFINGQWNAQVRQAARVQRAAFVAEQSASAHAEFMTEMKATQQQAYQMGLDPAADAVVTDRIKSAERIMRRSGPDGRPLFSPQEREKTLEKMREEIAEARTVGAFSRLPDLEAKRKFIDTIKTEYGAGEGQSKMFTRDQFHRLENELERGYNHDRVLVDRQVHAVQRRVHETMNLAMNGFEPKPQDMAAIESAITATKSPELVQEWADASAVFSMISRAKTSTPAELRQNVEAMDQEMRAGGTTDRGRKMLNAAAGLLQRMESQVARDPLTWARTAGLPVADLDVAPDKFAASLSQRVTDAEVIAKKFGRSPDYLTGADARLVSSVIAGGGRPALDAIAAIKTAAGDRADRIFAELKDKHGPATGLLGRVYADVGETKAVRDAADGLALWKLPDYKKRAPEPAKSRGDFETATDNALDGNGPMATAVATLAGAIYEKTAHQKGLTDYDPVEYRKAVKAATGEQTINGITYGGIARQGHFWQDKAAIVVPPFVRQDKVADVVASVTPDDLAKTGLGRPVGTDGKDLPWSRIKAGKLVQVDDGRYAVELGRDGMGRPMYAVSDANREKPFVLDFRALREPLSKRHPHLFLAKP